MNLALGYSKTHIMEEIGEPFIFAGWAFPNYVPLCRTRVELVDLHGAPPEFIAPMCGNCTRIDNSRTK